MLLQQLLQRNHQNVRQLYLDQKRKTKIFTNQYFQRKKPSSFKSGQKSLKASLSNLLQNRVAQSDLITKKQSTPTNVNDSSHNLVRDKFLISDFKTQRVKSGQLSINQHRRSLSRESQKKSRLQSSQDKFHKTNSSFYKATNKNANSSYVQQRKITTSGLNNLSPKFNSLQKGIFELPESFTIQTSKSLLNGRNSVNPFSRPHSTTINYESLRSGRQESIHSREKMRRQEQIIKNRKAISQQIFYATIQSFSQPVHKLSFLQESDETQCQKEHGICLDIGKVNLHQKTVKKNEYVNVFYEYRKSKAKLQKQDLYTPWKKQQQKNNQKSFDLTQLIHLHQY